MKFLNETIQSTSLDKLVKLWTALLLCLFLVILTSITYASEGKLHDAWGLFTGIYTLFFTVYILYMYGIITTKQYTSCFCVVSVAIIYCIASFINAVESVLLIYCLYGILIAQVVGTVFGILETVVIYVLNEKTSLFFADIISDKLGVVGKWFSFYLKLRIEQTKLLAK